MTFDLTDPAQLARRAPAYELAFAEAGHALDAQARTVGDFISRAGVMMAAAAVTTSIFGGQAFTHGQRTTATWLALAAFVGVGVLVGSVLWPRREWEFDAWPANLLAEYVEPDEVPIAMIHRDLAIHRAASFSRNTAQLRRVLVALRIGMCLLAAEITAWVVAVTGLG
jgi:hypothetical protein